MQTPFLKHIETYQISNVTVYGIPPNVRHIRREKHRICKNIASKSKTFKKLKCKHFDEFLRDITTVQNVQYLQSLKHAAK